MSEEAKKLSEEIMNMNIDDNSTIQQVIKGESFSFYCKQTKN